MIAFEALRLEHQKKLKALEAMILIIDLLFAEGAVSSTTSDKMIELVNQLKPANDEIEKVLQALMLDAFHATSPLVHGTLLKSPWKLTRVENGHPQLYEVTFTPVRQ